jgi:diguanylate cyclase (GGDEF)-like protein
VKLRALLGVLCFLVSAAAGTAAAPATGGGVTVLGSQRSGDSTVYELRVAEGKRPILIVLPSGGAATLEVDGIVRERAGGRSVIGLAPLGHAADVLVLAGLSPANRVVVRMTGPRSDLRIEYDADLLASIHQSGFYGGIFYAIIATVALFATVGFFALRDPAIAWFIGWNVSLLGAEGSRDVWLPLDPAASSTAIMGFSFAATFLLIGFCVSYLRLRSQAPRLFLASMIGTGAPVLLAVVFYARNNQQTDALIQVVPDLCALAVLLAIAVLRYRAGYTPAGLLIFGLAGIALVFGARLCCELSGIDFPFANRWGLEFGLVFVILAVSAGMLVRSRFLVRERARIVGELSLATYSALHDELTGLLNRRGLDELVGTLGKRAGTVLFIDVDAFKIVNDLGGHAAGDLTLTLVARILKDAIRSKDMVARVGGDEFVIFLSEYTDRIGIEVAIARISAAVGLLRPLGAENPLRIGLSIGSAALEPGGDFGAVLATADARAYQIKNEHYENSSTLKRRAVGATARVPSEGPPAKGLIQD